MSSSTPTLWYMIYFRTNVNRIPPLNNETKASFMFKWCDWLQRFMTFIAVWMFLREDPGCRPSVCRLCRPEVVSPPWYSHPPFLSPSLWCLIGWLCSDLPEQECTYLLMHFYVQAIWQWRVPSFLQHKYFIPHLDADFRRHTRNTNGLSLSTGT